ncbi:MAG: hypothetical protein GWN47_01695 [Woeseiaceae bacterium]|nr:hypothetical protein [Woeseiaceae bacterium]
MSHHVDRFFNAVSVLAGHGHIKQRLIKSFEENLVDISEDELPASLKQSFADLRTRMYRVSPLNGEGAICASVRKMSVNEASDCAVSVVSMYRELASIKSAARTPMPLDEQKAASVPPFLVKSS